MSMITESLRFEIGYNVIVLPGGEEAIIKLVYENGRRYLVEPGGVVFADQLVPRVEALQAILDFMLIENDSF